MARKKEDKNKPKISETRWADVIRRFVIHGESASVLARELGVTEGAVRNRAATKRYEVKELANQIVTNEKKYSSFDKNTKALVDEMVVTMRTIAANIADSALSGSYNSARLSRMATAQLKKVDEASPIDFMEELQAVGALTKLANEAATLSVTLINNATKNKTEKEISTDRDYSINFIAATKPE